jgi:hypothetical protein
MNAKHQKTLHNVFSRDAGNSIRWADIESLLMALGAETKEGRGSRVSFALNGRIAIFHRPHPQPTTKKGVVVAVRRFLESAGVKP